MRGWWRWCLCTVLAVGCSNAEARNGKRGASAEEKRKVELVQVRTAPMDERIVIAGTLAAQDEVAVKAKVSGRLGKLDVDLGSVVRAGQAMAEIEPVDYRLRIEQAASALAQARAMLGLAPDDDTTEVRVDETTGVREATATLVEARASFARAEKLVERSLIGRAEFDTAQATLSRAESGVQRAREEVYTRIALLRQRKAELSLARQQLSDTVIRAPMDGVVQARHASVGVFLAQGADVLTVVRVDPLRLRVDVPEREAARVRVGQAVRAQVDGRDEPIAGTVMRLAPMLNVQNRTLTVEAEIPNPGNLRPGSFTRATIALGASAPVLTVPESAVVVFAGIQKVITVADGKAVETPITTGRRAGDAVEVIKGLDAGASVVRTPGTLQQGQAVEVVSGSSSSLGASR